MALTGGRGDSSNIARSGPGAKLSDLATHVLLIDSERLDVSPPCGAALWGQRTSIWHGGQTSVRSLRRVPGSHREAG